MIEIKNLTKIYKTKKRIECKALNNINLVLPEKGFVFIVGKSGSGKSTLLNMISGVDSFTSGEIIAGGNKFSKMSRKQFDKYLSSYIGFIFQDYRLIDGLTIKQNIELALDISGKKEDVSSYLEKVDLAGYENKYPTELSGGEKQRVAIAGVLAMDPEVIIFDEATSMLDPKGVNEIVNIINNLKHKKTVISITHNLNEAKYADRVIVMNKGNIVLNDKPEEVFKHVNTLKESNLDILDSMKLIEIIDSSNVNRKEELKEVLWELSYQK